MENNNKITKKEAFTQILLLVEGNETLESFVKHELQLLEKRANTLSKAQEAKLEEREKLAKQILAVLADSEEKLTAGMIGDIIKTSPQKTTAILRRLLEDGKVTAEDVKRKRFYTLADIV